MKQCLQEADKCQATSIAFPALGAGNLEYPPKVVARLMVETIAAYLKTHKKTTTLETVRLAILLTVVYKEFIGVLKKQSQKRNMDAYSTTTTQQSTSFFAVGKLTIEIIQGDISEDDCDVVVNPTDTQMKLDSEVGKALLKKAGKDLESSLIKEISVLKEGEIFVTPAYGNLKCKYIYHVVLPDSFTKIISACLAKVDEQQLTSICFPVTGIGVYRPRKFAQSICEAVLSSNPCCLQMLRVVIFQTHVYHIFIQTCSSVLLLSSQPTAHNLSGSSKQITAASKDSKHESEGGIVLHINVFAGSAHQVQSALTQVQKFIQDRFIIHVIENDDRVSKLTKEQVRHLEEKAEAQQVEIKLEFQLKKIYLIGDEEDVKEMVTQVMNLFGRIAVEEGDRKVAKLLKDTITWKWQTDDEEYNAYDYMANYAIEQAYQTFRSGGCQDFMYNDQVKGAGVINFSTMNITFSNGSTYPLIRSSIENFIYKSLK